MKTTKDLIQFWIDNDLVQDDFMHWEVKITEYEIDDFWFIMLRTNTTASFRHYYIWLITSKPFIESIARGLLKEKPIRNKMIPWAVIYSNIPFDKNLKKKELMEEMVKILMIRQATAIMENSESWNRIIYKWILSL